MPRKGAEQEPRKEREPKSKFPTIIESHATTWHDGGVAVLLGNGRIESLAAERVGDRYKHSFNSRLAYDHLMSMHQTDPLFKPTSETDHFKDQTQGLETTGHHLYHAASAFYGSPFKEAAILIIDGQGPENNLRASTTIWKGEGKTMQLLEAPYLTEGLFAPQSVGHFYTAIGALAGMTELHEEGKTMGLAPYGRPSKYLEFLRKYAYTNPDGSYYIDPNFILGVFGNTLGKTHYGWDAPEQAAQNVFNEFMQLRGRPLRQKGEDVSQDDMDIACAGQAILEEIVLGLARRAKELTGAKYLCLAGGVALNSVTNGLILRSGLFKDIFIFPAAGDDGQAIGKLFHTISTLGLKVNTKTKTAYYGPEYSGEQIQQAIEAHTNELEVVSSDREHTLSESVNLLEQGKVIGWFQGGSEIGPRALGHRSILADPRNPNMRDYINSSVKHREWYRPFAPVVLEERVNEFFDLDRPSPFMLLVADVKPDKRDLLPAITHIDNSARIQTINKQQDELYYELVRLFGEKTGIPVLLNTSFNDRGEPIVETPQDAIRSFLHMQLDALVLGDILVQKKEKHGIRRSI